MFTRKKERKKMISFFGYGTQKKYIRVLQDVNLINADDLSENLEELNLQWQLEKQLITSRAAKDPHSFLANIVSIYKTQREPCYYQKIPNGLRTWTAKHKPGRYNSQDN
jgi:hypothetical protein